MSTVSPWLNDAELDWGAPSAAPAVRIPGRSAQRGPRRLGVVLATAAALVAGAVGFTALDRGNADAVPPAPPLQVPAAAAPEAVPAATLDAIARCESRGDPAAVSADGLYRGKYQFDMATWQSVGGSGDPALASEAEQDRRAHALAAERGTAPWPVCGPAVTGR